MFMIKSLFKLLLLLIACLLVYNYFMGNAEEKRNARKIVGEMQDLALAVKDLLQSEKEKFDAGKYDRAVDKIGNLFSELRDSSRELDHNYLDRIEQLEQKRRKLEAKLSDYEQEVKKIEQLGDEFTPKGIPDTNQIKSDMEELLLQTDDLLKDLENQH
jgi:hypothetical protein